VAAVVLRLTVYDCLLVAEKTRREIEGRRLYLDPLEATQMQQNANGEEAGEEKEGITRDVVISVITDILMSMVTIQ